MKKMLLSTTHFQYFLYILFLSKFHTIILLVHVVYLIYLFKKIFIKYIPIIFKNNYKRNTTQRNFKLL